MFIASEMVVAPNPFGLLWLAFLYLGLPVIGFIVTRRLSRRPIWCVAWVLMVLGFYLYRGLEAYPATSRRRVDITLVLRDVQGLPIRGQRMELTQYPNGRVTEDSVLTSDEDGHIKIVTTPDRKIYAIFRPMKSQGPSYRYAAISLEPAYKPTFTKGAFYYTWSGLRGDSPSVPSQFSRDDPITIPLTLPRREDADSLIQSAMRSILPMPYEFSQINEGPNKALEPTPTSVTSPAAQEPRQP